MSRFDKIVAGDRAALARAITLVESEQPDHLVEAQALIAEVLDKTGNALRVGITGVPGVGKSTFIDALGTMLVDKGHRVAVLAVDPSSSVSGGSILGDKTRMGRLARMDNAFIRPSPTSGTLGGVTKKTRESMLLCEAAGYDVILVETVGVGQSETVVADMVDFFLVLMLAGAGDELQGIKRGILEVADMLAINKADGDNLKPALLAQASYAGALRLMHAGRSDWQPPVVTCSAQEGTGLEELWAHVLEHREQLESSGGLADKRRAQQVRWMWQMVDDGLRAALDGDPEIRTRVQELQSHVAEGTLAAPAAAQQVLALLITR